MIEFEHPLSRDILTRMRSREASPAQFRELSNRLSLLLAVEATRNLSTIPVEVGTPFEQTLGEVYAEPPVIVAVLRAGLGMLSGFTSLLPDSPVAFLGFRGRGSDRAPELFVDSLPEVGGRQILLLHPVLAAGRKAEAAVDYLIGADSGDILLVSALCAPEGIARMRRFDALTIITAAVDREVDDDGFVRPGIGDFGLRLFSG